MRTTDMTTTRELARAMRLQYERSSASSADRWLELAVLVQQCIEMRAEDIAHGKIRMRVWRAIGRATFWLRVAAIVGIMRVATRTRETWRRAFGGMR